jgi:pyruvate formate lyase activating enzyme
MFGKIFNIQRFSVDDGPGIRTTIFLKGCSLRCFWCHNPEGMQVSQELQFFDEKCIACGNCLATCPQGATSLQEGQLVFEREKCLGCGACIASCYTGTRVMDSQEMSVEEVMMEVLQDSTFYAASGGGITLSGGEPVLQTEFVQELLEKCHHYGLHTGIETAGNYPWEDLSILLPYIDLVMMDIKHLDPGLHRKATGISNERILANARQLAQTEKQVIFRIPIIPTVNDTRPEITAILGFIQGLIDMRAGNSAGNHSDQRSIQVEFLPYHHLASEKYKSLGRDNPADQLASISEKTIKELEEQLRW